MHSARSLAAPRHLSFLFLLASCLLLTRRAGAQELGDASNKITIAFRADPNERPTHLCVVANLVRNGITMAKLKQAGMTVKTATDSGDRWLLNEKIDLRSVYKENELGAALKADIDTIERIVSETIVHQERPSRGAVCEGQQGSPAMCSPQFVIPWSSKDDDEIYCAENDQRGANEPVRVVVVLVRFPGESVSAQGSRISNVKLSGTAAALMLDRPLAPNSAVQATVVGGHYAEKSDDTRAGAQLSLALLPRCRVHNVQLPATAATPEAKVAVRLRLGQEEFICKDAQLEGDYGSFRMELPNAGDTKTLVVELGSKSGRTLTRLGARWTTFEPMDVVTLKAKGVSFSWKRHCLYPTPNAAAGPKAADPKAKARRARRECPVATLLDVGVQCPDASFDAEGNTCHYFCDRATGTDPNSEADVAFDLPTRVRFQTSADSERRSDDFWVESLTYANQVLSGYVAGDDRYLDIDLSLWGAKGRQDLPMRSLGDTITSISILGLSRRAFEVPPQPGQRIAAPGVVCSDTLKYQIIGSRSYAQGNAPVLNGRLVLDHPDRTVSVFSLGTVASWGGVAHHFPSSEEFGPEVKPLGLVEALVAYRPPSWRVAFEWRLAYLLSSQVYYPIGSTSGENELYHRHIFSPLAVWHFRDSVYAGAGPSIIVAHTSSSEASDHVGSIQWYPGLFALGGVNLGRSEVAIEFGLRLSYLEEIHAYSSDLKGETTDVELTSLAWMVHSGIRFGR